MPLVLLPEMKYNYKQQGFLELEDLITPGRLEEYNQAIDEAKGHPGRDLWRLGGILKQCAQSRSHAAFAKELTEQRELLLAFDQLYVTLPSSPSTITDLFSVVPLACALILQLQGPEGQVGIFPKKPGNGTWIHPHLEIDWSQEQREGARFLLIGYGKDNARFKENPHDPHAHLFKRMDYQNNSPLKPHTHPRL